MRPVAIAFNFVFALAALQAAGCSRQPDSPLTRAAASGDARQVHALLADGADANGPDGTGITPLSFAARGGHTDAVDALLAGGADPHRPAGGNGWAPLLHAIHKGQNVAAMHLLDRGASEEALNEALHMASGYANVPMVKALLAHGADPRWDAGGTTALSNAVGGAWDIDAEWSGCGQHTETVRALIENAPDLKLPDTFWGRSARRFARRKGCSEMLSLIDGGKIAVQATR